MSGHKHTKKMLGMAATGLLLSFSATAFAQGIDRRPHPDGGIYGPIPLPPPRPLPLQPDRHAGTGGSAPTDEQLRARAARENWQTMAGIRAGMTAGARWPTRFRGGNDGFLATIAWELSHPRNQSAFQSSFGSADRGVRLRFNYAGNDVDLFIPGTDLRQAVDALSAASSGGTGGYQFYEPTRIPPAIGAPRSAPLMLRLFGPQNGFETGSVWTLLGLLNTANPNRNFSPHNGWIGPQPGPRSAAPTPAPIVVAAGPESSPRIYDGMGSVGSNASRFQFTTSVAFGSPTGDTTGGGGGASR